MKLFDLHCDTATRLLGENQGLYDNNFHISIKRAEYLENYAQVMAIWTDKKLTDEQGYERFFEVLKNLDKEIKINRDRVERIISSEHLLSCTENGKVPLILAVEDARILNNDISRLDILCNHGVRLLTLNWYGETCIGGGHDTDIGLSEFGVSVVKKCFEIGIIPDISHCSFKGARDTIEIAKNYKKPIVASHSDSYFVNRHTRNLRNDDFIDICKLGGLVGINLCPSHLTSNGKADVNDIMKHIEHYLTLGGENTVAMGGDLDGTNLPDGFSGIQDVYKISNEMLKSNYSEELVNKIMYKNAFDFIKRSI